MINEPPPMIPLPERFKAGIQNLYGKDGAQWLSALPVLRGSLFTRWSLEKAQPVSQLSYNYLEFAHSPLHGPVVLKIGFPNPEISTEIKALKYYRSGEGAVRLLDWDLEKGALLLERVLPGNDLTSLADDIQATRIAAKAMITLRQSKPDGDDFPTMEKWCRAFTRYYDSFGEGGGPLPDVLFRNAFGLVQELLDSAEDQFLLHGDLHHYNLLLREDDCWITIDPKGVIGELACEAGPYLFNPIPDLIQRSELLKVLSQRLEILAEITRIDKQRLAAWSFCRAILAALWSLEEGKKDLAYWVEITETIGNLIR